QAGSNEQSAQQSAVSIQPACTLLAIAAFWAWTQFRCYADGSVLYCNSILLTVMPSPLRAPVTVTFTSLVCFSPAINFFAWSLPAASNTMIFLSSVNTP